jgi:diguanylate cyclase (GGDEF)-like protein/PAS domain S-box-containing protein
MTQDYPEVLSYLFEGVYVVDPNRKILFWNKGSETLTGYSKEEIIGKHCFNNILRHVNQDGIELCKNGCPLHKTLQTGQVLENDVYLHHKDGHRVPVTVKTLPLYDDDKNIVAAIEVFTDTRYKTDQYEENRKLNEMLTTDELTRVPNRRFLDFKASNLIQENENFETDFGLLFVDIDDFKIINDTYGHRVGDEVLKRVANTLKANVRANDIIGRWGGEEFIGLFKLHSVRELALIAEKLRILVGKSSYMTTNGDTIKVTVSIGGTMYHKQELKEDFIHRADTLMYASKRSGKNKVTIE